VDLGADHYVHVIHEEKPGVTRNWQVEFFKDPRTGRVPAREFLDGSRTSPQPN
jgi:hypothetical protein